VLSISFATEKGGAGKSTACLSIAGAYAKAGRKVHIIDLDTRNDISRWLSKNQPPLPNITISTCAPQQLGLHMEEIAGTLGPDFCFIDLAGLREVALPIASYRANLTIIPVKPSNEAEVFSAANVAADIEALCLKHGRQPFFRVLLTQIRPITTFAQIHGQLQVKLLKLPKLFTRLLYRTAYEDMTYSGRPPHFAPRRDTTAKAVAELDELTAELDRLLTTVASPATPPQLDKTA
jgi:chromosome partitioning protein